MNRPSGNFSPSPTKQKKAPSVEAATVISSFFANETVFHNVHDDIRAAIGILTARTSADAGPPSDHVSYLCRRYIKKYAKRKELLDRIVDRTEGDKNITDFSWSMSTRRFLEEPFSSTPATVFYIVLTTSVIVSCVLVVVQTMAPYNPDLFPEMEVVWKTTEIALSTLFCGEWIARAIAVTMCPQRKWNENLRDFFKKWSNNMDFIAAAVPTATMFFGPNYGFFNFFRLFRIFRVFLALRRYEMFEELELTLRRSFISLLGPLIGIIVVLMFFASLIYAMEMGSYDPDSKKFLLRQEDCELSGQYVLGRIEKCPLVESQFYSILHSMWWALATITTVGYGDLTPLTSSGRIVAVITIFCGNVFMAMPIAIVGTTFTSVVDWLREERRLSRTYHEKIQCRDLEYESLVLHETCAPATLPSIAFFRFLRVTLQRDLLNFCDLPKRATLFVDLFLQRTSDQFSDPAHRPQLLNLAARARMQPQPFSGRLSLVHPRIENVIPIHKSLNLFVGTSADAHVRVFGPKVLRALVSDRRGGKQRSQVVAPHQGNMQVVGYGSDVEKVFFDPVGPFVTLLADEITHDRVQLAPGSFLRFDPSTNADDDNVKVTVNFGYDLSIFHRIVA